MKARLRRIEAAAAVRSVCAGCATMEITIHLEYRLTSGEIVTLPPSPEVPPCTCRRPGSAEPPIYFVATALPGEYDSREAAERDYAKHAASSSAGAKRPDACLCVPYGR